MKRLICFFTMLFLLSSVALSAQDFGVRVGLNATNAKIDFGNQEIETDGQTNLALGLFLNLPIGTELVSIQPELTYINRGYNVDGFGIGGVVETETTVAYFDLGALVKLNFGANEALGFYVGAGPYFSYALSGTSTTAGDEQDIDFETDRINRSELQVAGAAGVTFGSLLKFFAEARYMGSLGNQSDLDDVSIKQRSIGLNAGIMIPIGG